MDKTLLRETIVRQLESERALLIAAAKSAKDEATSEENRPEGTHDMRGQLAAYLAEGQARIAEKLAQAIEAYHMMPVTPFRTGSAVAVGAVVTLESKGRTSVFLLGPAHGGMDVAVGGETVTVITVASPLGRDLVGKRAGEKVAMGNIAGIE